MLNAQQIRAINALVKTCNAVDVACELQAPDKIAEALGLLMAQAQILNDIGVINMREVHNYRAKMLAMKEKL